MKLRFFHVSDTHGSLPPLRGKGDFVVHSGDFAPNRHDERDPFKPGSKFGVPDREHEYQRVWFDDCAGMIKTWLDGRDLIYTPGNHCYYDPTERLRAEGIHCVNLGVKKVYEYDGEVPFFGFPFCPEGVHPWNYAIGAEQMEREIARMSAIIGQHSREGVIVAHCPPGGVLDKAGAAFYGNPALTKFLSFDPASTNITAVLCGHIHQDNGIYLDGRMLVSNAATTVHNITLNFSDFQ